jgi:hypothetical protein
MWNRPCPVCTKQLLYTRERNFYLANLNSTSCRSCVQLGKKDFATLQIIRRNRTDSSKVPKRTVVPTFSDLCWVAGFLDGEGCFRGSRTDMVEASQVDIWPLKRLQSFFGGSIRAVSGKGKRQDFFLWRVWGGRARGVQFTLYSLMSPRRQAQIEFALEEKSR